MIRYHLTEYMESCYSWGLLLLPLFFFFFFFCELVLPSRMLATFLEKLFQLIISKYRDRGSALVVCFGTVKKSRKTKAFENGRNKNVQGI